MSYIAQQPQGRHTLTKEIALALQIPTHFLAKIMQSLTRAGLLKSYRGPNGGFELARPAAEITPLEVIDALDGLGFTKECVFGLRECTDDDPCPVHEEWKTIREEIVKMWANKTMADLAGGIPAGSERRGEPNLKKTASSAAQITE